tara:strand:+ start:1161 stop:1364 length:204 start_codon:yes stop_codon:yes gene_type:complete
MQAVVLSLYLESLKDKIELIPMKNINEALFLDAEKAYSSQIPFNNIEDEVIDELDQLHEIYNQKNKN